MTKLYIIGAGCSENYSQGTTDIPGLSSPLDKDFFQMAKKFIQYKGTDNGALCRFRDDIDHLIEDLCEMYACYPKNKIDVLDDNRLSLESVMTAFSLRMEIFDRILYTYGYPDQRMSVAPRRLYTLIELVARTFSEALKGPVCEKHLKLAKLMVPGDIVFSYNYDILMDNALRETGKLTDTGYFLSFYRVFDNTRWTRPDDNDSQVSILKLHGSLNWLRCSICNSNLLMRHTKVGEWITELPASCPKCGAGLSYIERLLVPPLLTKNYGDPAINYLWLQAERCLERVNEVVVIGYSLPPTDFASETLLRRGIKGKSRIQIPVTVIDIDKEAKERFSRIFDPDKVKWVNSLDKYLNSKMHA